jgi:spore photoproduct lyase
MNLSVAQSVVREQKAAYAAAVADQEHALVRELWALRGHSDAAHVRRVAARSGLPVRWMGKAPTVNGERGMDKLMEERNVLLLRDRKSPFIEQFQHPLGRCAKFYKLTAYNNCNFWCEYCYLYLTFRNAPVSTHFVNYDRMFREIEAFDRANVPDALRVLNLGELGDPLAVDAITGFAEQVVPFMPAHAPRSKLLFLTKSDAVNTLLPLAHAGRTIVSFSVNTDKVWRYLEHRTPSPTARLKAARRVQDVGYEVRLRIDPVIRYSTWKDDYEALVEAVFATLEPSRITLGEYRPAEGLSNHIRARFPESPLIKVNGSLVAEAGKLRYPRECRLEMFATIIGQIRRRRPKVEIALCKENAEVWKAVGLSGGGLCCNCLG